VTGDTPPAHLVGGRAAPNVARVLVAAADGAIHEAVVTNGYWLAWWVGDPGSTSVAALDASNAILSQVPFTEPSR